MTMIAVPILLIGAVVGLVLVIAVVVALVVAAREERGKR